MPRYIFATQFLLLVRQILLILFTAFFCFTAFADKNPGLLPDRKSALAYRTHIAPRIDGILDDSIWMSTDPIADFVQREPVFGISPSFRTEVKIAFDNYAVYIGAFMYDPYPDSILRQLGLRDEENLNADMFSIAFDTYNNQSDAYSFSVTASGVQSDKRESDETYDGVWDSKVRITPGGWVAEIKIPYSALRFARKNPQEWGMEISRSVRRYRENDQWAPEPLDVNNNLPYWGVLQGISGIKPPVRLSATPYLLLHAEHFPDSLSAKNISTSISGGLDLKYGLNESFTLDITLLPDFSQVKSDNKIKNLTAFETVYEEQRPFFKEAVDLFKKGDIFYSRRIGKTPEKFLSVADELEEGEHLKKNPVRQKLLNATKLSGRNKNGLAIGLLNAVTGNTYAIAANNTGKERSILTDPMTNYNLLVFDQALKNNSDFYVINSNVMRAKGFRDANVTASGLSLNNKSNTYQLNLSGGMSQVFTLSDSIADKTDKNVGFKYGIGAMKTKGNFLWSVMRFTMDKKFDANDLGVTRFNNYNINTASVSYNFYEPFWKLRDMRNTLQISNQNHNVTHKPQTSNLEFSSEMTTMKYLTIWALAGYHFTETYDYYEPRVEGRFYKKPKQLWANAGFSSDYRKTFSLDLMTSVYHSKRDGNKGYYLVVSPIFRLNTHLTINIKSAFIRDLDAYGFAATSGDQVIFGKRKISTVENQVNGKYLFRNNLSLNLVARHYYAKGEYQSFYDLLEDGYLQANTTYHENHDFLYNSFNVDMVFSWIFAPGSSLNLIWKNEINAETDRIGGNYFRNFNETLREPQLNSISLKVLYYIDYQRVKRR